MISTVQRAPFDKMYGKKVMHLKDNFNITLIIKIVLAKFSCFWFLWLFLFGIYCSYHCYFDGNCHPMSALLTWRHNATEQTIFREINKIDRRIQICIFLMNLIEDMWSCYWLRISHGHTVKHKYLYMYTGG